MRKALAASLALNALLAAGLVGNAVVTAKLADRVDEVAVQAAEPGPRGPAGPPGPTGPQGRPGEGATVPQCDLPPFGQRFEFVTDVEYGFPIGDELPPLRLETQEVELCP